jgi:hypothetical protein
MFLFPVRCGAILQTVAGSIQRQSSRHNSATANMATCRACDAPLKVGANYCVVCGAKQRRLRALDTKFGALQLAFAAIACGVIAAAFSIGLGKPAVHEVRSTAGAIASNPSVLPAPAAYLEERAEEQDQAEPVITPQASATNDVSKPREHKKDTRRSTRTAAPAHSKQAKATLTAPIAKRAASVQQPLPLDPSSNLFPALPPAATDGGFSAAPTPPAAPDSVVAAAVPLPQPDTGANEPVAASPEMASIRSEPPSLAYQGRTSSQAEAAVRRAPTIDEIFQQRTARCGDGVIGLLCRGTMRLNVCNGRWTANQVPGMTVCYFGVLGWFTPADAPSIKGARLD